jgi:hypothetical protein
MPGGKLTSYDEWVQEQRAKQRREAEDRTRLLPDDLADQILRAAQVERKRLLDRIDAIDEDIETLEARKDALKSEYHDALIKRAPTRRVKRNLDGSVEIIEKEHERYVVGEAAIEVGKRRRAVQEHITMLHRAKAQAGGDLRALTKVEAAAERGVATVLMHIVKKWHTRVNIGRLADKVPMGRSHFADAAGNELPDEALDENGRPARLPSAREARQEADAPLRMEA